jgi:anti-sigma factor RsiW
LQIPAVDLGGGVQARELSTPVGTVLSWSDGGTSYTIVGSMPALELREAARGLLAR